MASARGLSSDADLGLKAGTWHFFEEGGRQEMTIFAERKFDFIKNDEQTSIEILFYIPTRFEKDFICKWEMKGQDLSLRGEQLGVDSLQAVKLAFDVVGSTIQSTPALKEGRLKWLGMDDVGI